MHPLYVKGIGFISLSDPRTRFQTTDYSDLSHKLELLMYIQGKLTYVQPTAITEVNEMRESYSIRSLT